jgi:valyl-tRNA synthetase
VRDETIEAELGALVELVRGIRNARAEANVDPTAWLRVQVAVTEDLAPTLDALRPAIERLSRARPLVRVDGLSELSGDVGPGRLSVVTAGAEAVIHLPGAAGEAGAVDRARLERELRDSERLLEAAAARLANPAFLERAPASVVEGARASHAELAATVARLRDRLGL